MPSAPSPICKPASFRRGLDFAARAPRPLAHLTRIAMSEPSQFVSRREFCAGACQVASCATLATLVSACSGDGSPTGPSGDGGGGTSILPTLNGQFANSSVQVTTTGSALANVGGAAVDRVHRWRVPGRANKRDHVHGDRRGLHARGVHDHRRGRRDLRLSVPRVALQPHRSGAWTARPRRHCVSTPRRSRTAS